MIMFLIENIFNQKTNQQKTSYSTRKKTMEPATIACNSDENAGVGTIAELFKRSVTLKDLFSKPVTSYGFSLSTNFQIHFGLAGNILLRDFPRDTPEERKTLLSHFADLVSSTLSTLPDELIDHDVDKVSCQLVIDFSKKIGFEFKLKSEEMIGFVDKVNDDGQTYACAMEVSRDEVVNFIGELCQQ